MPNKNSMKPKNQLMLICNPESGDGKSSNGLISEAVRLLNALGFDVRVAFAHPKEIATKLARKAARKGYRQVVVMGGDGTIEAAARALIGTRTRLGILPRGTFNNVAKSLGIPEDLRQACELIANGQPQKIDVGQVKTKKGKKFTFLEVAAVGLLADLYPLGKNIPQGEPDKIIPTIKELIQYQAPRMVARLDGNSQLDAESLLITVSNTPTFGDALLVAPNASLEDGELDVSFYPKVNKPQLVEYIASITGGKRSDNPKVERYRAKKITLKTKPKQEIMADGIILGKGKVKIKVLRGALRVIAGEQAGPANAADAKNTGAKENKQVVEKTADQSKEQKETA